MQQTPSQGGAPSQPPPPPSVQTATTVTRQATTPAAQQTAAQEPAAARASTVARLLIAAAVFAAVVLTIFCAQNTGATTVHFLVWSWPGASLFVVILAAVGLGIVIGGLFVWLRLARYSAQHRILKRNRARS